MYNVQDIVQFVGFVFNFISYFIYFDLLFLSVYYNPFQFSMQSLLNL